MYKSLTSISHKGLISLLVICLGLLTATGYFYWQTVQRQQSMISSVRENLLWAAMQLDRESSRWQLFLKDAAQEGDYDPDRLELRFEILFSRYNTLKQGELGAEIAKDAALNEMLRRTGEQLDALDGLLNQYYSRTDVPLGIFDLESEYLAELSNDFLNRVVNLRSEQATTDRRDLLETFNWLTAAVMLLISATIMLIYLLLRGLFKEQRQVKTVSRLAEKLKSTAEEAKAASQAKSAFLAMMSHEIRTPLNGIIGMLNVLTDEPLAKKPLSYVTSARDSADHLLVIVNDILDLSSIEAGRLRIQNESMVVAPLLSEIKTVAKSEIGQKPIRFELVVTDAMPAWLEGDWVRVRQVILNLVSNAVKFTERGHIILGVEWVRDMSMPKEGVLRFEVEDTGIGIEPSVRQNLFQEFSQLENTMSRRFSGTGLGLSICKKLVELMRGKIGYSSRPGQGSRFWFEVPARIPPESANKVNHCIAYCGFDSAEDLEAIHQAGQSTAATLQSVNFSQKLPAGCELVLVNWTEPLGDKLNALYNWQSKAKQENMRIIGVIDPNEHRLAYQFIKAGGHSILKTPLDVEKLYAIL